MYKKIAILFVVYFLISLILVFIADKKPTKTTYDAIVVLGLRNDYNKYSPFQRLRLEKAIELYNQNLSQTIIVSGNSEFDEISEAQLMEDYLKENNIPANAIIKEDRSLSTEENILYTKQLMDSLKLNSSLIITSSHHTDRTRHLSNQFSLKNSEVISAKNNLVSILSYIPLRICEQTKFDREYPFKTTL